MKKIFSIILFFCSHLCFGKKDTISLRIWGINRERSFLLACDSLNNCYRFESDSSSFLLRLPRDKYKLRYYAPNSIELIDSINFFNGVFNYEPGRIYSKRIFRSTNLSSNSYERTIKYLDSNCGLWSIRLWLSDEIAVTANPFEVKSKIENSTIVWQGYYCNNVDHDPKLDSLESKVKVLFSELRKIKKRRLDSDSTIVNIHGFKCNLYKNNRDSNETFIELKMPFNNIEDCYMLYSAFKNLLDNMYESEKVVLSGDFTLGTGKEYSIGENKFQVVYGVNCKEKISVGTCSPFSVQFIPKVVGYFVWIDYY